MASTIFMLTLGMFCALLAPFEFVWLLRLITNSSRFRTLFRGECFFIHSSISATHSFSICASSSASWLTRALCANCMLSFVCDGDFSAETSAPR